MGYYDYEPTVELARPLCLFGFVGCGASGLGLTLCSRTGLPLIDVDRCIEHKSGMDVGRLWLQDRARLEKLQTAETKVALRQRPAAVVVLGFSAVQSNAMLSAVLAASSSWYLELSARQLHQRLTQDWSRRRAKYPPFALRPPETVADVENLLRQYEPNYRRAARRLQVEGSGLHELAERILSGLPKRV